MRRKDYKGLPKVVKMRRARLRDQLTLNLNQGKQLTTENSTDFPVSKSTTRINKQIARNDDFYQKNNFNPEKKKRGFFTERTKSTAGPMHRIKNLIPAEENSVCSRYSLFHDTLVRDYKLEEKLAEEEGRGKEAPNTPQGRKKFRDMQFRRTSKTSRFNKPKYKFNRKFSGCLEPVNAKLNNSDFNDFYKMEDFKNMRNFFRNELRIDHPCNSRGHLSQFKDLASPQKKMTKTKFIFPVLQKSKSRFKLLLNNKKHEQREKRLADLVKRDEERKKRQKLLGPKYKEETSVSSSSYYTKSGSEGGDKDDKDETDEIFHSLFNKIKGGKGKVTYHTFEKPGDPKSSRLSFIRYMRNQTRSK